ncbi:MAG: peptidylprolyl isomerase [Nitrosomonas sp.]|nr:peptidylprolyl isomerase [Nitrosomonas sp.]
MLSIQPYLKTTLIAGLFSFSPLTHANPVACFNSNTGDFCIELFETQTPNTTANFLNYISNETYTSGIFHRSVPGFVIQAGGYKLVNTTDGNSLAAVETFPPIANEFKISNTRGTVAMAKLGGDPDSATSQWFINLGDNSANLDNQNGGFTVFGRVVFDGMSVIDTIGSLPVTNLNLGSALTEVPTKSSDGTQVVLVVTNSVNLTEVSGVFSGGFLSFTVDIGGGEFFDVRLQLIETSPNIVFELDSSSVTPIQTLPENSATYVPLEGTLTIPSVMIDSTTVVTNVIMELTNASSFQFTLISMEQAN